jgi:hypothetical protein
MCSSGFHPHSELLPLPAGKGFRFLDIIRTECDKPLKAIPHLIIHFLTMTDQEVALVRRAAFQPFVDFVIVCSSPHLSKMLLAKKMTREASFTRVNCKKVNAFGFTIDIPQVLSSFPIFEQLMGATMSQQIDWGSVKGNLSPDTAMSRWISVFSKWMSFVSFINACFLNDFLVVSPTREACLQF